MPTLRTYNLFISHAWAYDSAYSSVVDLLQAAKNFQWRNHSAPSNRPVVPPGRTVSKGELIEELRSQIRGVHAVIVIAGMYVAHSDWIQAEIDIANGWGKPIIGLKPRGAERLPTAVSLAATEMVGWTTDSIVGAVRRHALA